MSRLDLIRDLDAHDFLVLRDLVRFGVLRRRHIDNRYGGSPLSAGRRLGKLVGRQLVTPRTDPGLPRHVFEATPTGTRLVHAEVHLKWRSTPGGKVVHDLALVDLAAYWHGLDPEATWITERELNAHQVLTEPGHRPDGLVITSNSRLAIEFERSPKTPFKYEEIHRWFARATRIDGIRWYVTTALIKRRLEATLDRQGLFGLDVEIAFAPAEVQVLP